MFSLTFRVLQESSSPSKREDLFNRAHNDAVSAQYENTE